jgi:hypothetical protein
MIMMYGELWAIVNEHGVTDEPADPFDADAMARDLEAIRNLPEYTR